MGDYRKLDVWRKAHALAINVLRYALNSASELEYHLTLARDIQVLPNKTFTPLANRVVEVRKMLHGLLGSLTTDKAAMRVPRTVAQS